MGNIVVDSKILKNKSKDKLWVRYIKNRIAQNKNFLGFISGQTGSGKSWSSISIAEQLDPEFKVNRIVFSGLELMRLINSGELKKGSVIVFEEAGIGLSNKNWQSTINKMLNFLIQTFRHKNFILIFNSPFMDFVDASTRKLFHAEFITCGIDRNKGTCKLKPRTIQYNGRQNKFYYKMLRVITDKGVIPIAHWNVEKPSKSLIEAYEDKKTEFTTELNQKIQQELQEYEDSANKSTQNMGQSQKDVLNLLEEGLNVDAISKEIHITPQSIRRHIQTLRNKGYTIRGIRNPKDHSIIRYVVESPEISENKKNSQNTLTRAKNLTGKDASEESST